MKVGIIGAGAAGLMSAASALEYGRVGDEVIVFEKNSSVGKKILITGGGRCNVTTGINDINEVLKKYPRGEKFLSFAMHQFSPFDMYKWIERHGVKLKIEDDKRVFPNSNNGADIVGIFEKILKDKRCKLMLNTSVNSIKSGKNKFIINSKFEVNKLILSVGGNAYATTGSTGDGYVFAKKFGHTITSLAPSLHGFSITEKWPKRLAGLSFSNAKIKLSASKNHETNLPFIFTHTGLSGPGVFVLSSLTAHENLNNKKIRIDFLPDVSYENLRTKIESDIKAHPNKKFANTLDNFLQKSFADAICIEVNIGLNKVNSQVPKKNLNHVVEFLKNCELTISGNIPGEEFVTAGGISLNEVDSKTMESKKCPGLYFAGEILDIDAFTGGFNLQAAWCTGRLAGKSAVTS